MRLYEFDQISKNEIHNLELALDILFSKLDIDVDLSSKHFFDRLNDIRNNPKISLSELSNIFKEVYQKYGKLIKKLDNNDQGVLKDLATQLNIPFIIRYDDAKDLDILKAKTVMRKPNFTTPDPVYPVNTKR